MLRCRSLVLLFFALCAVYIAGDWALPLVDRDEPRFAEASREMLQRDDFVIPYFNGQTRFDKPPLIYWMQCACYEVLGRNELAARLPSGLCAAAAAVVIAIWGSQLYDPKTGMRAAVIFGLCAQTVVHAHAAVADMAMVAAVAVSGWAGWHWLKAGGNRLLAWQWGGAFWALLALGFLAKGPIAFIPIGMAGWTARKMECAERPGALAWVGGLLFMLALIGVWGIPALVQTHGAFAAVGLGKHVVMRSISPLEGHGARTWTSYAITFPFYLATVWPSFFPWSFWLPHAAGNLWVRRKVLRLEETYLVTGIVLVFGIFTLSRTKLPHYTLPAFPFLALLVAAWWSREREGKPWLRHAALATASAALLLTLAGVPFISHWFVSQQLYQAAAPLLTAPMEMATVGYHEPSLIWLFRAKIDGYESSINAHDAAAWMAKPGPRLCVIPLHDVAGAFPAMDKAWRVVSAEGFQVAHARRIQLAAVIKP